MPGTEFDLGFDDYEEEEEERPDGTKVQHLPPPPEIGGMGGYSEIHGNSANAIGGRSTSPRLFVQAAGHPTVSQLRVWKIENGIPVGLGAIESEASEDDLVRQFISAMPKPGEGKAVFKLRPIDIDGREMGTEATAIIGEHHTALTRMRAAVPRGTSGPAYTGGLPSEVLNLMQNSIEQTRSSLDNERERGRELMHQMAQERIDLASSAATSIQAMSERLLEAESKRAEQAMRAEQERNTQTSDSMAAFFGSQLEVMRENAERQREREEREKENERGRWEREREDIDMRRSREMEEWERRRQRDREEWERRLMEMKAEAELRERARERDVQQKNAEAERRRMLEKEEERLREEGRKREHELKMRQMEIEAAQKREHDERMAQIQQAQLAATLASQKPGQTVKDMLKEGMSALKLVGIEPSDLVQRLMAGGGGGPDGNQWAELAGKTLTSIGEVAKAKVAADAERKAVPPPRPPMGPPPGQIMIPAMRQGPAGMPPQGYPPPPMAPPQGYPPGMPPQVQQERPAPSAEMNAPSNASPPPTRPQGPLPGAEKLKLPAQRLARKSIRELVRAVAKAPNAEWEAIIAAAITSEPAIYHYVNAVTVRAALMEARASAELVSALIVALKASPLVPDDLNYGE